MERTDRDCLHEGFSVLDVEIGEEIGAISNLNSWILCWLVNDTIRSRVPGLFMKFHGKKLENHCLQSCEVGWILIWWHEWDEGPTDQIENFILQKDVINKEWYLWLSFGFYHHFLVSLRRWVRQYLRREMCKNTSNKLLLASFSKISSSCISCQTVLACLAWLTTLKYLSLELGLSDA